MKLMTNVKGLRKFLLKLYKDMNIQVLEMYVKTNVKSEKISEWPALPVMIIMSLVSLARIEVCFAEIFWFLSRCFKTVCCMDNGYLNKAKNQRSGQRLAFWAGLKPAPAES